MDKKYLSSGLTHAVLIIVSLISVFPFIWLLSTSLKGVNENIFAYPPVFIPQDFTWSNYWGVWQKVDFMRYFWNSLAVSGLTVILNLIFSALAGYPLARMKFGGKKFFFFMDISPQRIARKAKPTKERSAFRVNAGMDFAPVVCATNAKPQIMAARRSARLPKYFLKPDFIFLPRFVKNR